MVDGGDGLESVWWFASWLRSCGTPVLSRLLIVPVCVGTRPKRKAARVPRRRASGLCRVFNVASVRAGSCQDKTEVAGVVKAL